MENRSHALMAGLFTVAFLLAAAAALWWLGGGSTESRRYLLETRGNVTGLNLEAQVRYRGIRAGKVQSIRPDPQDADILLVEISVDRAYSLTDKTVARLNLQGITGLTYVMLEESGEDGVPLQDGGGALPRLKIQPGIIQKLGEQTGDIAAQLAELSLRLNRLFDDRNLRNLQHTLDNLSTASDGLREVPRLMDSLHAVFSPANRARLETLLSHLEKTAGEAAPLAAEARALVGNLNTLARRFDGLTATAGEAGARLTHETLPRAEALMIEATQATRRLDALLDTLNATPQALLFGASAPRPGPGEPGFVAPPAVAPAKE